MTASFPLALASLLAVASTVLAAGNAAPKFWQNHQVPDKDGIYYVGPEVSEPKLVKTVYALYPSGIPAKQIQGMTVMAMVIDANGKPAHIELLHSHGQYFDRAALGAVKHSAFEPGTLKGKPVPVWIDVRVVYFADRARRHRRWSLRKRISRSPMTQSFLTRMAI